MIIQVISSSTPKHNSLIYGIVPGTLGEIDCQIVDLVNFAEENPTHTFLVNKLEGFEPFVIKEILKHYTWSDNVFFNRVYL